MYGPSLIWSIVLNHCSFVKCKV